MGLRERYIGKYVSAESASNYIDANGIISAANGITSELEEFSHLLIDDYLKVLGSDWYTLNRLKEIWIYSIENYPSEKKIAKEIKKSQKLSTLINAIRKLPEIE